MLLQGQWFLFIRFFDIFRKEFQSALSSSESSQLIKSTAANVAEKLTKRLPIFYWYEDVKGNTSIFVNISMMCITETKYNFKFVLGSMISKNILEKNLLQILIFFVAIFKILLTFCFQNLYQH